MALFLMDHPVLLASEKVVLQLKKQVYTYITVWAKTLSITELKSLDFVINKFCAIILNNKHENYSFMPELFLLWIAERHATEANWKV